MKVRFQSPYRAHGTRAFCEKNMAKSIRSKRKRKLRAARREKLKPKVKAKLEEILGITDKEMIVDTESREEDKNEEESQRETQENQEDTTGKRLL